MEQNSFISLMYKISNLELGFQKRTFLKCPFLKSGGRDIKKHRLRHSEHNALNSFFKLFFLLPYFLIILISYNKRI